MVRHRNGDAEAVCQLSRHLRIILIRVQCEEGM
jgi:hypothetical protein